MRSASHQALLARAIGLHQAGKLDAAVAAYQAIVKRHPETCACWSNLGMALRTLGRKDEGLEVLREGVRVRSEGATSRRLSLVHGFAGRQEYALQRVETLLDFPERDLDRVQPRVETLHAGTHLAHVTAHLAHIRADVIDPGIHAGDLRR